MTQEPNNTDKETATTDVSKLLIDRPSDFRFHAAYLIYSGAWDKNSSPEVRKRLNDIIEALSKNQIDYDNFYREMNQYRVEFNPERYSGGARAKIETQRKKDWRRIEAKNARNARHRRR